MPRNPWALALLASLAAALVVSPAWAQYLSETREIQWSDDTEPDLLATATELGSPAAIYEYVRNHFDFALYDGARSNSINAFLNRRGNDVDIASVLIAMLRSQGVPARYAAARVSIDMDDVASWLEIPNALRAKDQLSQVGFQNVDISGSNTRFDHVWVQAQVPLDRYRAAGPAAQIDCTAEPQQCTWIDLDPSFKLRRYRNPAELVDVSDAVVFDYTSFYNAEKPSYAQPDGIDRREKSPLEIYEEQILRHLHTTPGLEGKTLEEVIHVGEIIPEEHGILPTSLPFDFDPALVQTWASVDDHDGEVEPNWTKTVSLTVTFPKYAPLQGLTLSGGDPIPLADLATQDLTFAYESTDFDDPSIPKSLVVRLGGAMYEAMFTLTGQNFASNGGNGTITGALPDPETTPFNVQLTMEGSANLLPLIATYPDLILGGYFLVATGGDHSGWSQLRRSARRLSDAVAQHPVVDDESRGLVVDADLDGDADPEEVRLLEDAETQILLTGGVLAMAKDLYYAQVRDALERVSQLQRTVMSPVGFLGVVSSVHDVASVDGTAFQIIPDGLLVDMKALQVVTPFKIDEANVTNPPTFRLGGHIISALEHEIWQEITGYEAISTMKGIQRTLRDGAELMVVDQAQAQVPIQTALTNWGFQTSFPPPPSQGDFTSIDMDLFGLRLWLPRTTSASLEKTLDVIRETVDGATPALQKTAWPLELTDQGSALETGFFDVFESNRNLLQSYPPNYDIGNPISFYPQEPGCVLSDNSTVLLDNLDECFFAVLDRPEWDTHEKYAQYFDKNTAFVVGDHLYRDYDPKTTGTGARHIHSGSLAKIRDEVVLGPGGGNTVEFVVPNQIADGERIDFAVWIKRIFSGGQEQATGYIINRAGGGYVTGLAPLDIYDPLELSFNHESFTNQALTSGLNNSILTPSTIDPVATVTGNVFHDETDLRIKGRGGLDYLFTRTYNSGPTQADPSGVPMGHRWTHSYNVRLIAKDYGKEPNAEIPENSDGVVSSITYVDERGGESIYGVSGVGPIAEWTVDNPRGTFDTLDLSEGGSGTYVLRFRNGHEYVFGDAGLSTPDAVARLKFIRDPFGNELSFAYDTSGRLSEIRDNLGILERTGLELDYFTDGRLKEIRDWLDASSNPPGPRVWSYSYDGSGNLKTFTDPRGDIITYEYESPDTHQLTAVVKPEDRELNGQLVKVRTTFDYYANGRGFSNANTYGDGEQLDYDLFRKRTRLTGPRGFVTSHFYDANGELTKVTHPDGAVMAFQHNANGRRWERTDPLGFTTQYSYCTAQTLDGCLSNTGGNVTREQDPLDDSVFYEYSPLYFDQLTKVTDKRGGWRESVLFGENASPLNGEIEGKEAVTRALLNGVATELSVTRYHPDANVKLHFKHLESTGGLQVTEFMYDPKGLNLEMAVTQGTNGNPLVRRDFGSDDLGRLTSETLHRQTSPDNPEPLLLTTSFQYDALDRVIRVTDALGNETHTDYDDNGQLTAIRVKYNDGGALLERTIEARTYDAADRLREVKAFLDGVIDGVTTFEYDAAGNLIRQTDPTGIVERFEYNSRNRLVASIDGNGHRGERRYDQAGRLLAQIDGSGNTTTFEYDSLGRRTAVVEPAVDPEDPNSLRPRTDFQYDENGNLTHVRNANALLPPEDPDHDPVNSDGASVFREYDELNRLTRVVDARGNATTFEYDLRGNRTEVKDALDQRTMFRYSDHSQLVEILDPVQESPTDLTRTFAYDEADNLLVTTDREGNTTQYTYDRLNRLVRRDFQNGDSERIDYDVFGNVVRLWQNDVLLYSFEYDGRNRLKRKTDQRLGRELNFLAYDAAGRLLRKTDYQGEETEFLYDGAGRLVAERNPAYLQVSYHYDPAGRVLNRILSNGARTDYSYDGAGRLTSFKNYSAGGTEVDAVTYGYDAVGNITSATRNGQTATFTYDELFRLEDVDYPGGDADDRHYTYDDVGNRLTEVIGAGPTRYYCYGDGAAQDRNRLLQIRDGACPAGGSLIHSFVYDDNGALIAKKQGPAGNLVYSLVRNDRGQVVTATGLGFSNSFAYDLLGLRIRRDDDLFHLEGDHLEAVYDSAGALRAKYLRGSIIDEVVNGYLYDGNGKPTNLTFHHDQVNSVLAVTGHAGALVEEVTYAPFGEEIDATGPLNALRFTGRERDPDTGLYYYRARYYDPVVGRFLSEDPLGFGGGDVNLYAYVGNNPLRFNDPTGQVTLLPALVGAVVGGATSAFTGLVQGERGLDLLRTTAIGAGVGAVSGLTLGVAVAKASLNTALFAVEIGASAPRAANIGIAAQTTLAAAASGISSGAGNLAGQAAATDFEGPLDFGQAVRAGLVGTGAALLPALGAAATTFTPIAISEGVVTATNLAVDVLVGGATSGASSLLFESFVSPNPLPPYPGAPDDFSPVFRSYCSPKCF